MSDCSCCGTGGGGLPLPGDPSGDSSLSATWFFGGINIVWTLPLTNPHAMSYVRLYRSTSSDFGTANQIAVVTGDRYFDQTTVAEATTYYYWIQIVSINGTVGDTIGPASATAIPRIDDYLELLTDRIDNGVLATALKNKILSIDQLGLDITAEGINRQDADDALSVLISTVQTDQADLLAAVIAESSARTTADSALATSINTVQVEAGDNLAAVQVTLQSNIDTVAGEVTNIGALYTVNLTVNNLVGGFGVYNDGSSVEAGFDVDTFWVGRTSLDKVKPFIITGGIVYMDSVVIQDALIESLSAEKILAGNIEVLLGIGSSAGIYGGKTSFSDTTHAGFWLGLDGSTPKFIFGNADNSKSISWDGTTLLIEGDLIATGNLQNNAVSGVYLTRNSSTFSTAGSYAYTDACAVEDLVVPDIDGTGTTEVALQINWSALTSSDNSGPPSVKWRVYRTRVSGSGTASGTVFDQELTSGWKDASWAYVCTDSVLPGTYDYTLQVATSSSRDVFDSTISVTVLKK